VLDGDTIEVLKDKAPVYIRLYGIDCPEHDQDFGTRAKQFTSDKVFGKTVEVVPIEKDRYERLVAKIYIDGKYLNQMIVAEGFASWYKRYAPKDADLKDA
jgi:endonuclease YncB( thermonuclease family)